MLPRDRGDRGALLALGLVLFAIVLVVWFQQPVAQISHTEYSAGIEQPENRDIAILVAAIREFDPWDDSYAQWIMALLSFFATGVSIWAVCLVKDTLKENRKATQAAIDAANIARQSAEDSRRIGRAAASSYLFVESGEFVKTKQTIQAKIQIRNSGSTPAERPSICADLSFRPNIHFSGLSMGFMPTTEKIPHKTMKKRWLEPNSISTFHLTWLRGDLGDDHIELLNSEDRHFVISCHIEWRDLFDERHWTKTDLSNHEDFLVGMNEKNSSKGKLYRRDFQKG